MINEYYGAASTPTDDFLAHYGIKGMKWGVRKAIARGNQKALDRHFRKAARKLRKLQDIGLHSGKYAAKSAAYGAAAAGVGTLVVGGTGMTAGILNRIGKANPGLSENLANRYFSSVSKKPGANGINAKRIKERHDLLKSGELGAGVEEWGKKPAIEKVLRVREDGKKRTQTVLTNDALYRIGAGAVSVGLAAKSAQNAYRAKNGAKYRQKASEFKNAMDDVFSGTKYAGKYVVQPKKRKRRV